MKNKIAVIESSNEYCPIKALNQFHCVSLGEGAATCQVCGLEVREGTRVVAYAFRPAGAPAFEVGHVLCEEHQDERFAEYTIGVRELVIAGRVGKCTDVATQSTERVLLSREVLAVSGADSKELEVGFSEPAACICGGDAR